MTAWRLRPFDPSVVDAWDAFVRAHPDGSFCHLAGWERLLSGLTGYQPRYCYVEGDGQIVAVLPMALVRRPFGGLSLVSTPFFSYGGVLAADAEACAMLQHEALRVARDARAMFVELRGPVHDDADWDQTAANATFVRILPAAADAILTTIPRKQRAEVRKADRAGLVAERHRDVARFFPVYAESLRNLGSPVGPRAYYEGLMEIFGDDCSITSVRHGEHDVGAVLSFQFGDTVMPYHGGGRPAARNVSAFAYMYWRVMFDAVETRGASRFDFGRSPVDSSAAAFKRNFGFEATPLVYARHRPSGGCAVAAPSASDPGYKFASGVWRKLPLRLANRLGPWALRAVV